MLTVGLDSCGDNNNNTGIMTISDIEKVEMRRIQSDNNTEGIPVNETSHTDEKNSRAIRMKPYHNVLSDVLATSGTGSAVPKDEKQHCSNMEDSISFLSSSHRFATNVCPAQENNEHCLVPPRRHSSDDSLGFSLELEPSNYQRFQPGLEAPPDNQRQHLAPLPPRRRSSTSQLSSLMASQSASFNSSITIESVFEETSLQVAQLQQQVQQQVRSQDSMRRKYLPVSRLTTTIEADEGSELDSRSAQASSSVSFFVDNDPALISKNLHERKERASTVTSTVDVPKHSCSSGPRRGKRDSFLLEDALRQAANASLDLAGGAEIESNPSWAVKSSITLESALMDELDFEIISGAPEKVFPEGAVLDTARPWGVGSSVTLGSEWGDSVSTPLNASAKRFDRSPVAWDQKGLVPPTRPSSMNGLRFQSNQPGVCPNFKQMGPLTKPVRVASGGRRPARSANSSVTTSTNASSRELSPPPPPPAQPSVESPRMPLRQRSTRPPLDPTTGSSNSVTSSASSSKCITDEQRVEGREAWGLSTHHTNETNDTVNSMAVQAPCMPTRRASTTSGIIKAMEEQLAASIGGGSTTTISTTVSGGGDWH